VYQTLAEIMYDLTHPSVTEFSDHVKKAVPTHNDPYILIA